MGNSEPQKRAQKGWTILWVTITVAVVVVVLVVGAWIIHGDDADTSADNTMFGTTTSTVSEAQEQATEQGWVKTCESTVKGELKSPATAQFSNETDDGEAYASLPPSELESKRGLTVDVTGDVDSQNGFGALMRSSWKCTIALYGTSVASTTITDIEQR